MNQGLSPANLLYAYINGYFPMADEQGVVRFYGADPRAVFDLATLKPSKRMRRILRDPKWEVTLDKAFENVIRKCAERDESWITEEIIEAYCQFHQAGHAHAVEVWSEGQLVGGLYGVAIGGAFFGESMFNTVDNAAKVAFHSLVRHLQEQGFILLDSQFANDFTRKLGVQEIAVETYMKNLHEAVALDVAF